MSKSAISPSILLAIVHIQLAAQELSHYSNTIAVREEHSAQSITAGISYILSHWNSVIDSFQLITPYGKILGYLILVDVMLFRSGERQNQLHEAMTAIFLR